MSAIKTEQELRDEFDILSIEQKIDWALDTIRHKESFGMDELNASLSRERRAKGVLLDCKKTIEKQKKEIEQLNNTLNKCAIHKITLMSIAREKERAIAEAREIIKTSLSFNGIKKQIEAEEKAKAWLENNR